MRTATLVLAALVVSAPTPLLAQGALGTPPDSTVRDERLPASEQMARGVLETTPRHGEFVDVPWSKERPPLRTWIVYPERKTKAGVVLIIHEIYGLSDWIRGVADQLAREGFIAVAPDLISGLGPGGGGTDSLP